MSDQLSLPAELREGVGKGASRALRREGRVPAVIYGDKKDPVGIHVEEKLLAKMLQTGHFMNSVVEVTVGKDKHRTLPKDVQFHPVTSRPVHVDFFRLAKDATVTVAIPVHFKNEDAAPGLKRGGVLNIVRHDLELVCDATNIPDEVVIDLTGLEVGDAVHISAVTLPKGTKSAIEDRDFTIATLVAPSSMKSDEDAEAETVAASAVPATAQDEAEDEEGSEEA